MNNALNIKTSPPESTLFIGPSLSGIHPKITDKKMGQASQLTYIEPEKEALISAHLVCLLCNKCFEEHSQPAQECPLMNHVPISSEQLNQALERLKI